MTTFSESFGRVIDVADPKANSPITENNKMVKALADWGRMACREIDKLQAEIDQLKTNHENLQ